MATYHGNYLQKSWSGTLDCQLQLEVRVSDTFSWSIFRKRKHIVMTCVHFAVDFFWIPNLHDQFAKKSPLPREIPWWIIFQDGVYTYGLFFEACRWNWSEWKLAESEPKVLYATCLVQSGSSEAGVNSLRYLFWCGSCILVKKVEWKMRKEQYN